MTENPFRADVDHYLRTAALNAPPPPIPADPLAAGLSPMLCVGEQLGTDEADDAAFGAGVYRYKRTPLPDEVARLAARAAGL